MARHNARKITQRDGRAVFGSTFIATPEANAADAYKGMIVESGAEDILYSSHFTGVHGNYLKPSIVRAGLDPDSLAEVEADPGKMDFSSAKAWKDIWGCGQGIGAVREICPAGEVVDRLCREYDAALAELAALDPSRN